MKNKLSEECLIVSTSARSFLQNKYYLFIWLELWFCNGRCLFNIFSTGNMSTTTRSKRLPLASDIYPYRTDAILKAVITIQIMLAYYTRQECIYKPSKNEVMSWIIRMPKSNPATFWIPYGLYKKVIKNSLGNNGFEIWRVLFILNKIF